LGAATNVGDGGVVFDFVVGLALGAGEDFVGGLKGREEAEATRVAFRFGVGWCFVLCDDLVIFITFVYRLLL